MSTPEKDPNRTSTTRSHRNSLSTAPSSHQNDRQNTSETPSAAPTKSAIRSTSENSLATLYSTGITTRNSKPLELHTLACLPNRSAWRLAAPLAAGSQEVAR